MASPLLASSKASGRLGLIKHITFAPLLLQQRLRRTTGRAGAELAARPIVRYEKPHSSALSGRRARQLAWAHFRRLAANN